MFVLLWGVFLSQHLIGMVILAGIILWLGYLPDVKRVARRHDDIRRLAMSVYLLTFAIVFGMLSQFAGPVQEPFLLLVGFAVVGGIILFVTSYFRL